MLALISAGRNWANVQSWFEKGTFAIGPAAISIRILAAALVSAVSYGVKNDSDTSSDAQHHERASFLLTDVDEFGVNHIVLAAGLFAVISAVRGRRLGAGLRGSGLVHGLGQLVAGGREPVSGGVDPFWIVLPIAFLASSSADSISLACLVDPAAMLL